MTTVGTVLDAVGKLADFSTAESWDNVGLLIGGRDLPVSRALVALDLTTPVLAEAVDAGAELVVTHHPVLFHPLKALEADSLPYRAVRAGISVISAHTNLDLAWGGVNDALAAALGLELIRAFLPGKETFANTVTVFVPAGGEEAVWEAMAEAGAGADGFYTHCAFTARGEGRFRPVEGARPAIGSVGRVERVEEVRLEMLCPADRTGAVVAAMRRAHPYEQPAYQISENRGKSHSLSLGRLGELPAPCRGEALAARVKERLAAAGVRYVEGGEPVRTVAVCGGSGGNLLAAARKAGAQALVTGEAKHDQLLEAGERGMTLVDGGHFATENVVVGPLRDKLAAMVEQVAFIPSQTCTDGAKYLA